jgi:hypothetical protein
MHLKANTRQRLLLYTALGIYDALAKSVHQGLEALNLSVMDLEVGQSRSGLARQALEKTKINELTELTVPLALVLTEALALYYQKTEAKKKDLTKLQVGIEELEETQQEIKALAVTLSDQPDIFDNLEGGDDDDQGDLLGTGVDGKGTPPPKAEKVRPLTGVPD